MRIKTTSVVKYFEDKEIVKEISIGLPAGRIYGLLGPNGAGKTTILRMLAGILTPSEGEVYINDYSMRTQTVSAKASLGFLTGDMNLYERLTPLELLNFFGNLYQLPKYILKERIEEIVSVFHIDSFAKRVCSKLSTGQKQRVAIARTVLHNPAALILDEPTTGLDIMSSELILGFIQKMVSEKGMSVIFSTHNLSEVERLCHHIGIVNEGKMVFQGTLEEAKNLHPDQKLSSSFFSLVSSSI